MTFVRSLVTPIVLLLFAATFVYAGTTTFNSAATFNTGTYYNSYHAGSFVNLSSGNTSGVYQSPVINSGHASASWSQLIWNFEYCYACELPISQATESAYTTNVNMTGNVLYYKFNETALNSLGDGNDTLDSSGNGKNGDIVGSVSYGSTGLFGKSIEVTNSNQRVAATSIPYLQSFTTSAWIKLNSTSTLNRYMVVIARGNYGDSNSNFIFGIRRKNAGAGDGWLPFAYYKNGGTVYGGETLVYNEGADGEMYNWHHIASTYDSATNNFSLFFDGVVVRSAIQGADPGNVANSNTTIGAENTPTFSYFTGFIDEVAIWNRSLSESEVKAMYYRGAFNVTASVRSCSSADCSDSPSFTQILDASSGQTLPLSIANNRYAQFNLSFTRATRFNLLAGANYSPLIYNISFDYAQAGNVVQNIPVGWTLADINTDTAVNEGTDSFTERVKFNLKRTGSKVVEVWLGLNSGNADLSRLIVDSKNTNSEKKAVVDWRNVIAGDNLDQADHALYTDATWANGAYVCPTAYTTDDVSTSCAGKVSFTHGQCQSGTTTSGITCTIVSGQYKLAGLSGTGVAANGNTQMTINDSAEGSNVATNTAATFYAYYHTNPGNAHIAGATCQIEFDDNPGVWNAMTEDAGNGRYTYTKAAGFATAATHTWQVDCVKAAYTQLTTSDTIQVGTAQTGSIPFFEDLTLLLALILAGLGAVKINRLN